jgi:hypothetical protein
MVLCNMFTELGTMLTKPRDGGDWEYSILKEIQEFEGVVEAAECCLRHF